MTVLDLILILKTHPEDMEVRIWDADTDWSITIDKILVDDETVGTPVLLLRGSY